jgi:hypothetical protein
MVASLTVFPFSRSVSLRVVLEDVLIAGFSPFDLGIPGEIAMASKARCPFSPLSGVGDEDKLVSLSDAEPTLLFFLILPAVVLFAEVV